MEEIKGGRTKALQEASVKYEKAVKAKMGYEQCIYIGTIRRMKYLLVHENRMTQEEVDRIEKEAKEKAC